MINCVVVFGGENCEHDISVVTGGQVIRNLDEYLYNIIPVYIDKKGVWWTGESLKDLDNFPNNLKNLKRVTFVMGDNNLYYLKNKSYVAYDRIDFAFLCLHGMHGEDGSVASVLELSKIPYSSAGIMASAVCLDKSIFKYVAKGMGVNVVDGIVVDKDEFMSDPEGVLENVAKFLLPVIVKPARQGSSVGIEVCKNLSSVENALNKAFLYDDRVVVEKFVDIGKELNVAIFDNKGSLVYSQIEEPVFSKEILSFDDKYLKSPDGFEGISRILPAQITPDLQNDIREVAGCLYKQLKLRGVVRFDFILSKAGELFINEVNTIPGSMANYLFDKVSFRELLELLRSNGVVGFDNENKLIKTFSSNFLTSGRNFIKK